MGRERIYSSAAERQKAYRARATKHQPAPSPAPALPKKKGRQLSRPRQLAEIDKIVHYLLASYEDWREQMPDSLEGSPQVDKLDDTIEKLNAVADTLADIDPPLGFGRD